MRGQALDEGFQCSHPEREVAQALGFGAAGARWW